MPIVDPTFCMLKVAEVVSFSGSVPCEHSVQKLESDTKTTFRETNVSSAIDTNDVANSGIVRIIDDPVGKPNQLKFVRC